MFNFNVFHFRLPLSFSKASSVALPKTRGELLSATLPGLWSNSTSNEQWWGTWPDLSKRAETQVKQQQQQKWLTAERTWSTCVWKERWQVLRHDSIVRGYMVVQRQDLKDKSHMWMHYFQDIDLANLPVIFTVCFVVLEVLSFLFSFLIS